MTIEPATDDGWVPMTDYPKLAIFLSPEAHDWLRNELTYQLNMERSRLRFAAAKHIAQINTNIDRITAILGAIRS